MAKKLKEFYCVQCDKEYLFDKSSNYSTICPICNNELEYINDIDENDIIKNDITKEELLRIMCNDIKSIKSMIKFFVILTLIDIICTIIINLI